MSAEILTTPLQFHVLLRDRTIFAGLETNQRGAAVLFDEVPMLNFSQKVWNHMLQHSTFIELLRTGHVVYS